MVHETVAMWSEAYWVTWLTVLRMVIVLKLELMKECKTDSPLGQRMVRKLASHLDW